mgnify:FL=1
MRWTNAIALTGVLLQTFAAAATAGPAGKNLQVELDTAESDLLLTPEAVGTPVPVTITVRDAAGRGQVGLEPRLETTAGRFGPLSDAGGGVYRTHWQPPEQRHPQAVILAAKVEGGPPGWSVIRLHSRTELPTRSSKPRVQVTIHLGDRTFGPVRSDARGRVSVPVEVAPGQTRAKAVAVDEFGNRREREVRIPLPPVPRLLGFAERQQLAADGHDATWIYLIAIEPDGSPDRDLRLVSRRRGGELDAVAQPRPGLYRLRYTAPAGLEAPQVDLTIADRDQRQLSRCEFTFALTAGTPTAIELRAEPDALVANGVAVAELKALVTDKGGNPLEDHPPRIGCARGTVGPVRAVGRGRYRARYQAPVGRPGPVGCQAELQRPGGADLQARAEIRLQPPQPGRLELAIADRRLPMDGRSQTRLQIAVYDEQGQPLDGVRVEASAGLGGIDPPTRSGPGRYHASYTAPRGQRSTRVRVEVRAGPPDAALREHVVVELEGVEPPPPPAPWATLGPSAALLTNFGRMLSGGFSVDASGRIPGLAGYLYLALEGGYRYGRTSDPLPGSERTLRTEVEYAPLHLLLLFKPLPTSLFTPVIGIGGGAEFVQWTLRSPGDVVERDHTVLLGSLASLGGELRLGPGALVIEARYLYAFLRDAAAIEQESERAGSRIKGSVGGLDVRLGYQLHF